MILYDFHVFIQFLYDIFSYNVMTIYDFIYDFNNFHVFMLGYDKYSFHMIIY